MSVITYELLLADKQTQGSICNWISNDSVPPLMVLRLSEQWASKHLRIRQMSEISTGVITAGSSSIAVPDRLIDVRALQIVAPLNYAVVGQTIEGLLELMLRESDGTLSLDNPTFMSLQAQVIQLNCRAAADLTYTLLGTYALPPLSAANPVNWLTDQGLDILMFTCAGFASEFLSDPEESSRQLSIAKAGIDRVNKVHGMALRNIDHAVSAVR